jgi:hypothetical protein
MRTGPSAHVNCLLPEACLKDVISETAGLRGAGESRDSEEGHYEEGGSEEGHREEGHREEGHREEGHREEAHGSSFVSTR